MKKYFTVKKVITLILSLSLGVSTTWFFYEKQQSFINAKFAQETNTLSSIVKNRLNLYEYGLLGTRSAISLFDLDKLTLAQYRKIINSRSLNQEFPGLRGIGIMRNVPPSQKEAFLKKVRKLRNDDSYNIKQLKPHEDDLFVVQYIEPENLNIQAVGFDSASNNVSKGSFINAFKANKTQLTPPLNLIQAPDKIGFLLILPLYPSYPPLADTENARLESALGAIYAPLIIDEMLGGILTDNKIGMRVYDIENGNKHFLFTSNQNLVATNTVNTITINIYGRTWELEFVATPNFILQFDFFPSYFPFVIFLILGGIYTFIQVQEERKIFLLNDSQKKLNLFIQHAPVSLAMFDKNMCYLAASKRWVDDYNLSTNVVGQSHYALFPDTPQEWKDAHQKGLNGEVVSVDEELFERLDGKKQWLHWELRPWRQIDNQIGGIIVFLEDVTASVVVKEQTNRFYFMLEQEVVERTKELNEDKLKAEAANIAKSSFLAVVSHEIRTPLNAIIGLSHLLQDSELNEGQKKDVVTINKSSKILLNLINDVLDFSKIEASEMQIHSEIFSLTEIVEEMKDMFSRSVTDKKIEFLLDIESNIPSLLFGDSSRLKQILINLINNAIKFTQKGSIQLKVFKLHLENDIVQLKFLVSDTGIGISKENQKKLFQPFVQADNTTTRKFGGTGLGLSITKKLVNLMGGQIYLESEFEKGSIFSFDLPFRIGDSLTEMSASSLNNEKIKPFRNLAGLEVLVVDDSYINLDVIERNLKKEQLVVTVCDSGFTALELIHQREKPYDIILMDLQMPQIDGCETTKLIRNIVTYQNVPILALTAGVTTTERQRAFSSGINEFLVKPISPRNLISKIQENI